MQDLSIEDLKVPSATFTAQGVVSMPDRPSQSGYTAAQLKAAFDNLAKNYVGESLNALIDALTASTGAAEIGAGVTGVTGANVQSILAALKSLIDEKQAELSAGTGIALNGATISCTVTDTNTTISSVSLSNNVLTIEMSDGTSKTVDMSGLVLTDTNKYVTSGDVANNILTLTFNDATTIDIDLSAFSVDLSDYITTEQLEAAQLAGGNAAWLPSVDANGNVTWTRSITTTAPASQNIKGPQGEIGGVDAVYNSETGDLGLNGNATIWLPTIDANGNITWARSASTAQPTERNIKGGQGIQGAQGIQGIQGLPGSDAEVTEANITSALGYTPTAPHEVANAITGTLHGYAVRADDVSSLAHSLAITQYGQCTQDGTPTPAAPVAITGKAAGAKMYGKNLYHGFTQMYGQGVSFEELASGYRMNITRVYAANKYSWGYLGKTSSSWAYYDYTNLPHGNYTVSFDFSVYRQNTPDDNLPVVRILTRGSSPSPALTSLGVGRKTFSFIVDDTFEGIMLNLNLYQLDGQITAVVGDYAEVTNVQLELGSTATAYEPYAAPVTQTVTDAGGDPVMLYGIPVASGGNVTIGAQQYVADTLEGSVVTRRVGHIASYNGETITTAYLSGTGELSTGASVYYVLAEPTTEEVTLTPATLSAVAPTTTFVAEAYSDVGYNRDANKVIAELTQAIISLGGTI